MNEKTLYEEMKERGWKWRVRLWIEERKLAISEWWYSVRKKNEEDSDA